jgi:hypothetical protein
LRVLSTPARARYTMALKLEDHEFSSRVSFPPSHTYAEN